MSLVLSSGVVNSIKLRRADRHEYDLINLKPEDLPIEVLAHNVSILNRFGGNAKHPWSVASHSVLVSLLLPEPWQYEGLMHDAVTEGTGIVDLPSPVKKELPDYQKLEQHIRSQMAGFYGLEEHESQVVKVADKRACELENFFLRGIPGKFSQKELYIARPLLNNEIPWKASKQMFLEHYRHLFGVRGFH